MGQNLHLELGAFGTIDSLKNIGDIMLSRRSFAKLCGLSTIPLFTGLDAVAAPSANRSVTYCDLKLPDIAQVFTKTDQLEFPLEFITDGRRGSFKQSSSIRLCPYMIQQSMWYKSKYKGRPDVVNRTAEILANAITRTIEADMLRLLFSAGLESIIVRKWKYKSTKWSGNDSTLKFIMSPETMEHFGYDPSKSGNPICSFLLGKDEPFQQDLIAKQKQILSGDLCLRIGSGRPYDIVLTQLPSLPPLIGFNTSFDFDPKTRKVIEKPLKTDGKDDREFMFMAYFCAMGVLDHKSVTLLDLEHNV